MAIIPTYGGSQDRHLLLSHIRTLVAICSLIHYLSLCSETQASNSLSDLAVLLCSTSISASNAYHEVQQVLTFQCVLNPAVTCNPGFAPRVLRET